MAGHESIQSFTETAIAEYLLGSKLALEYRKGQGWHPGDLGGCLGMTSAVLLFCVLDAIGSFCRRDPSFEVIVDGTKTSIGSDGYHHFFVLNSIDLYAQTLSEKEIKGLYDRYRSLMAHNAAIAPGGGLITDYTVSESFPLVSGVRVVNVPAFHRLSCVVAERFFSSHNIEHSEAARIVRARAWLPPSVSGG